MKNWICFRTLVAAALLLGCTFAGTAVTDKEMEEARAITAKNYLRYVNNGSDYLDNLTPKSLAELEGKLKTKEQENIKAFKSVKVPGDYASWDKEKLVEFWAVTFFTSPALDEKGKGARVRVRKQIGAMTISAPAPAKEEPKQEEPTPEQPAAVEVESVIPEGMPTAEAAADSAQDILSDQNAIEQDAQDAQATHEEPNHTWVYVLILAVLIAVVIWLVVYAARLMKRSENDDENEPSDKGERDAQRQADNRASVRESASANSDEIERLRRRLANEEEKSAQLGLELERIKLERSRLEDNVARLREENNRLKSAAATVATGERIGRAPMQSAEQPADRTAPRRPVSQPRTAGKEENNILRVIYLGRANKSGIFVRADRRISAGNTIYRLDTNDGLVGTFHVVDEPEVVDTALSAPVEYLSNGCTGEDLEDTTGVTRIITDSAGTAIFENGYWKVLRKTRVHYE